MLSEYIVRKKLKVCTHFINEFKTCAGHRYCDVYIGINLYEKYDYEEDGKEVLESAFVNNIMKNIENAKKHSTSS